MDTRALHTHSAARTPIHRGCARKFVHTRAHRCTVRCTHVGAHTHTRACTHMHWDAHTRPLHSTMAGGTGRTGRVCAVRTWPWGWWHLHKRHGTWDLHRSNPGAWGQRAQGEPQPQSPRGRGAATTSPQPRRSWGCLASRALQPSPGKAAGCACQILNIPVKFFPHISAVTTC